MLNLQIVNSLLLVRTSKLYLLISNNAFTWQYRKGTRGLKAGDWLHHKIPETSFFWRIRAQYNTVEEKHKARTATFFPVSSQVQEIRLDCRLGKVGHHYICQVPQFTKNNIKDNIYVMVCVTPYANCINSINLEQQYHKRPSISYNIC